LLLNLRRAGSAEEWFYKLEMQVHSMIKRRRKRNDKRVRVAVLDTGIDQSHPRIIATLQKHDSRIIECKDWLDSESGTADIVGHGTCVSELLLRVAKVDLYVGKVFNSRESSGNVSEIVSKV
jgi:hypothetical protein